jgi:ketosteroid isomerase-like protein
MDNEARLAELEHRVKGLEDKQAIAELLVRYGQVVDDQDADGLRELFTDDARFHSANGLMDGRGIEGVMQHLAGRWDMIKTSYHITHGHIVNLDPDDSDEATGVLFSHAEIVRDATPMISALRYDDRYRRVEGKWRFAERKLSFYYYVEADGYVADLMTDTPVRVDATARPADVPRRESVGAV